MTRWPPRPTLSSHFYKAHGLGNDYLVFEEGEGWVASASHIRRVCDRHRGVGSDGIVVLLGTHDAHGPDRVCLRMFNPDGGEFERSGNGLRILASLMARRHPSLRNITAEVAGTEVRMTLHGRSAGVHDVSVEMGRATVGSEAVHLDASVLTPEGSLLAPDGEPLLVVPVSVGNPHIVVLTDPSGGDFSEERLSALGPYLSSHPGLTYGANVQLATAVAPSGCRAFIWERGVGRTSASGTSACAVAVAMVWAGRLKPGEVTVEMPGGTLTVGVSEELEVTLRGPVEEVLTGELAPTLLDRVSGTEAP